MRVCVVVYPGRCAVETGVDWVGRLRDEGHEDEEEEEEEEEEEGEEEETASLLTHSLTLA